MWLSTAFLATKHHRSAFYFLREVVGLIYANLLWEGAEVEVGDQGKGNFSSYFMVFSDNASFRLPVAYVLITSKHDGVVCPVE